MDTIFHLPDAIAVLERTPATLRALLDGLPDGWTTCDEGPDTFTPIDNVGHLIHGERTDWIPRPDHPRAGPRPPLRPLRPLRAPARERRRSG